MKVIGFRCSNTDYAYCVMSGTRHTPVVEGAGVLAFPTGFAEPEILKWFHQEVGTLLDGQGVQVVGIRKPEALVGRSNALDFRIQCEGVVSLASAESGCLDVYRKVKATIAKDLGLKGRGKYLKTSLDTAPIPGFKDYPTKVQDAILVAWSCED